MSYSIQSFYEYHIKELEKRLSDIYTVNDPIENKDKKVNLLDELQLLVEMEKIYSTIENGNKTGEVYKIYNGYLNNVRKSIPIINAKIEEVEKENKAEIENIEILLKSIKKQ